MTALSTPARPVYIKTNKNKINIKGDIGIDSSKINDKIANVSNTIKKISFRMSCFISKASLAFT